LADGGLATVATLRASSPFRTASKRQLPTADRVKRGCLYLVIFGIPGIVTLIRYVLALTVIAIVALYAVTVSAAWGLSALVDAIGHGRTGKERSPKALPASVEEVKPSEPQSPQRSVDLEKDAVRINDDLFLHLLWGAADEL